jgi:hypothetical protein
MHCILIFLILFHTLGNVIQGGQKLVGADHIFRSLQGQSVAISDDKLTLAVGGYDDSFGVGAVWVYSRSSLLDEWPSVGLKIVGSDYVGNSYQGYSVSLSANGKLFSFYICDI